jgi:hypothetical protein
LLDATLQRIGRLILFSSLMGGRTRGCFRLPAVMVDPPRTRRPDAPHDDERRVPMPVGADNLVRAPGGPA